ncbi:hypothetical protein B0A55_13170 [Friedmanniomyces simplex]|uniref:Uncharacterized protein n=1 Tax=Friedmanniomyces simplex TaxID=329884 RepID=A0A4U0VUJ8_9PEZI|nr:hypothetical protein B0A55_13170 [Friedmanniomyces simplex]
MDMEHVNYAGDTALCTACRSGEAGIVRLLLQHGANPDGHHDEPERPLILAAETGNVEAVTMLLNARANVNAMTESRGTALHCAVFQQHKPIVQLLVNRGACLGMTDSYGQTALDIAALHGDEAMLLLLRAEAADLELNDRR